MSATVDAETFAGYFAKGIDGTGKILVPVVQIPGFTYPVKEYYMEDIIEATGTF